MNDNHHASERAFPANESLPWASIEEIAQARRTAYALGQLEGEEKAIVEAELATSAAARKEVLELHAWSDRLRQANRAVVVPPSPALRETVVRRLEQLPMSLALSRPQAPAGMGADRSTRHRSTWYGDWRGWTAAAAAACLLAMVVGLLWSRGDRMPEQIAGGGLVASPTERVEESVSPSLPLSPSPAAEAPKPTSVSAPESTPSRQVSQPSLAAATQENDSSAWRPSRFPLVWPTAPTPTPAAESSPEPVTEKGSPGPEQARPKAAPSRRSPTGPEKLVAPASTMAHAPSRGTRHLAAAKPGFLEVYMSTRPPDLAAPRPAPPGTGRESGPTGLSAKSQPSQSHLALPPGMRPDKDQASPDFHSGVDPAKGSKKTKATPPEPASPDKPSPAIVVENDFIPTARFPYSAFSLTVDPGALASLSRSLRANQLPPADHIQIEDLVNAFHYEDPQPAGDELFAVGIEAADCPWARGHRLVRIAISSRRVSESGKDEHGGGIDSSPPIADDVRVQVQFNPLAAASYRLIGYDSSPLVGDQADENSLGGASFAAGQTVVAMYQIVPAPPSASIQPPRIDSRPSKAQRGPNRDLTAVESPTALLTVRLRYQRRGEAPHWLEVPWTDPGQSFDAASADFRFSAAVAGFGMTLRGSRHRGHITLDDIERIVESSRGNDRQRAELLELIRLARQLRAGQQG